MGFGFFKLVFGIDREGFFSFCNWLFFDIIFFEVILFFGFIGNWVVVLLLIFWVLVSCFIEIWLVRVELVINKVVILNVLGVFLRMFRIILVILIFFYIF